MNDRLRHRIIFGIPDWSLGGPSVFIERAVRGLSGRGHDASVLLTEHGTALVDAHETLRARPADIPISVLPCGPDDTWGERWAALIGHLERRTPCTYVMVHDWRNNVVAPRLSSLVRLIGVVQADYMLEREQAVRLGPYWDAIVAVSDVIHFGVANRAPALAERMVTIDNAVPLPASQPDRSSSIGPLRAAYVGVLREGQKRLADLIDIASELDRRGVDVTVTLIGDGEARQALESRAGDLIARRRVRFLGELQREAVEAEMRRQDVVMLTSEFEGLSLALLEAMALGCIPVVTDIASHQGAVEHDRNGFRVKIGDIMGFADRLAQLTGDAQLRGRLSAAAAGAVRERYDFEAALDAWERLIDVTAERAKNHAFRRPAGIVVPPPEVIAGIGILPGDHRWSAAFANSRALWPGPVARRDSPPPGRRAAAIALAALDDFRILVAAPGVTISGVDVFAHHLIRQLRRAGLNALVLAPHWNNQPPPETGDPEIPVDGPALVSGTSWMRRWRTMAEFVAAVPSIYVPNYDWDYSCIAALLPAMSRVISIAHSDDGHHYDHVARLAHIADATVGVSRAIVAHIAELAPQLEPRLHHVPYGVDVPDEIAPRPYSGALRIVYSGRLENGQKRVRDLAAIAQLLDRRGVDFTLSVIGAGEDRDELERHMGELVVRGRVRFMGRLDGPQVLRVLRKSDVLLLVSAFEGLSIAMLEAMANGVVPVTSAIRSGVPETIVPGENGLLAPVADVAAFVDHLAGLAGDRARLDRMARAAHRTMVERDLTVARMARDYQHVFEQAIADPAPRTDRRMVPTAELRRHATLPGRAVGLLPYDVRVALGRRRGV